MLISHIQKLQAGGFNVPVYVLNPYQKYRGELVVTLKEHVFAPNSKLILLAETKKGPKQFHSLSVQEVSLIVSVLEKKGDYTMVLEQSEAEFFGKVWWDSYEGKGGVTVDKGGGPETQRFAFVESLPEVRLRSVARLAIDIQGYMDVPGLEVDYVWSTNFVGVNQLKLVVYDYKFLPISS